MWPHNNLCTTVQCQIQGSKKLHSSQSWLKSFICHPFTQHRSVSVQVRVQYSIHTPVWGALIAEDLYCAKLAKHPFKILRLKVARNTSRNIQNLVHTCRPNHGCCTSTMCTCSTWTDMWEPIATFSTEKNIGQYSQKKYRPINNNSAKLKFLQIVWNGPQSLCATTCERKVWGLSMHTKTFLQTERLHVNTGIRQTHTHPTEGLLNAAVLLHLRHRKCTLLW